MLSINHGAFIQRPSGPWQTRHFIGNQYLIGTHISIMGVVPEFIFYTMLCGYFGSKIRDKLGDINSTNFNTICFSTGIFLGGAARLLTSTSYYFSTFNLLRNRKELVKKAKSGHDFAGACCDLYHYNRLSPIASFVLIGILYLMIIRMAALCGTKLYEASTENKYSTRLLNRVRSNHPQISPECAGGSSDFFQPQKMNAELKAKITRDLGTLDAPGLIALLESVSV